ncbi:MAG: helix-turn-helix transcriptional regulator [Rubrivivax sp.]|nr:helix-turn-helix transcriptional regulator [Rubrivivax sp.]
MSQTLKVGEFEVRVDERRVLRGGHAQPLGARAFELLVALAQHRDRVVGKQELMARVWPRLVVEDNNLTVQMAALRKLLGPGCIATVPGRGYRLTADGGEPPASSTPSPAPAASPGLFGRADELAALRQAVGAQALVTLLGPAGIGKTSLARALAAELGPTLADGAALVELAPLNDPALVLGAVAAALGLPPSAATSPEALAAAVAGRQGLLVLDNCEHLGDAVAAVAAALRAHAPGLRLLVTSQVPLQLPQEQRLRLGPLALPAEGQAWAEARRAGAVALFEARARALDPQFEITPANADGVAALCRRLDGVALAIELAAARVRWLGVQGLLDRLQAPAEAGAGEQLQLLAGGARLALPRHQTLRAALAWSHALLSAEEQAVFRRLGVFAGGFSLAAVQQVASDAAIDEWAVLDLLGQLIDRSLVVADFGGAAARAAGAPAHEAGEPRYRLLQSLREFALEQLAAHGEAPAWRRRHAEAFCALAFSRGGPTPALRSPADRWPLVLEHDNLRAALDTLAEHDAPRALAMAAELLPFWRERGHHAEAQRRCVTLLAHPHNQAPSAERARVRVALCGVANERNETALIRPLAQAALADARVLGLPLLESLGHIWLAHAEEAELDLPGAAREFENALALLRPLDEPVRVAETLTNLACIQIAQGRADTCGPLLDEALALYSAADNLWGQGFALSTMAEAAMARGEHATALPPAEAALALHRRLQHQHRLCFSLVQCAALLLTAQRVAEMRDHLAEALALALAHGFQEFTTLALVQAALLAAHEGRPQQAATLLGAVQASIDRGGAPAGPLDQAQFAQAQRQMQAVLGTPAYEAAWAAGLALPAAAAAALATQRPTAPAAGA